MEELAAGQGVRCVPGEIVSGEQFVTDSAVKERIARETRADAIEMEGAAVGHACYLSGVPFAVVRCISDGADDSGGMDYDTFVGTPPGAAPKSPSASSTASERGGRRGRRNPRIRAGTRSRNASRPAAGPGVAPPGARLPHRVKKSRL